MAFRHQGWLEVTSGLYEWERLVQLADGTRTPMGVADILNQEYGGLRPPHTTNAVRKKCKRMDLPLRKNAEHAYIDVIIPQYSHDAIRDDIFLDREATILVINDLQCPYHDPKVVALVRKFADEYLQPDEIYLLGDVFDFYPVSRYSKSPERRSQWRLWDEIQESRKVIEPFLNVRGVKRVRLFGGNHEDRLRRYLVDRAPELIGIPYLEIHKLLDFELRDYIPYHTDELHIRNNLIFTHGSVIRKHSGHSAKAHVEKYGMSIIHGHSHRGGSYLLRRYRDTIIGQENFCLCDLNPGYTTFPNWAHGFSVVSLSGNNERFHIEPVPIAGGGFLFYGEHWSVDDVKDTDGVAERMPLEEATIVYGYGE